MPLALAFFLLVVVVCLPLADAQALTGQARTLAEQYLFHSINDERAAAGLPFLIWNQPLAGAAALHASRMRAAQVLSHQLDGEPDLKERAAAAGAHFSRVAENIAVGRNVLEMHDALMESQHHRDNILDPGVNSLAIAIVHAGGELWAVEDFARDVEVLSFADQEEQVVARLRDSQLHAAVTATVTQDARETCRLSSGFVGERPGFVMRYTTSNLQQLPGTLLDRIATGRYHRAAVGACAPEQPGVFTSYNLAIVLYR